MDRCPICETRTVRRGWPTRWRISRVEIDKHGATEDQIYGPLAAGESVVVVPLFDAERLREKVSALEARRDSLVEKWNKAEDDAERLRVERNGLREWIEERLTSWEGGMTPTDPTPHWEDPHQ
jgi:hypothetical protein